MNKQCEIAYLTNSMSSVIPARQLFFVRAWSFDDDPISIGFNVSKVLYVSIVSRLRFTKSKTDSYTPPHWPSVELFEEHGWYFDCEETSHNPVILDEEYGLLETNDELLHGPCECSDLVVLPDGMLKSDSEFFDEIGLKLVKEATEKRKRFKERQSKKESSSKPS